MAKQTKNQKYGRATRSVSGKLQSRRTEKNKMKSIERARNLGDMSAGVARRAGSYNSRSITKEDAINLERARYGNQAREMLDIYINNTKLDKTRRTMTQIREQAVKDVKRAYPKTLGLVL